MTSTSLSDEVRELKRLLGHLQSEIQQAARGSASDLALEVMRLRQELDESVRKHGAVEREAERWRDAALHEAARRRRLVQSLKAKVIRREVRRIQMVRSASWRLTAPLRMFLASWHRLMLGGARFRRRLFSPVK